MSIEAKLAELGLKLPDPPAAAGSYVPTVRTGNLLYCAGTICAFNGQMTHTGQVGASRPCRPATNRRASARSTPSPTSRPPPAASRPCKRIVFVSGFVNAVDGFADSPAVINGASDLFVQVFGEAGRHARAAVAVAGLPRNATTEIQVVVELKT